jgi:adenine-specific DNA-methyltransferase
MGRRWVTVEWLSKVVEQFTLPRLTGVVKGTDLGGVTTSTERVTATELPEGVSPDQAQEALRVLSAAVKAGAVKDHTEAAKPVLKALRNALKTKDEVTTNWDGGGGFRVLDVAPSMFSLDDGEIYLSGWATGEPLSEAVAAQFGFVYAPEGAFAGHRGTVRLAVVDGFVNEDFVDYLVSGLSADELVEIYATGIDPDAQTYLKKLLPGSRLVKIPASIISSYRRANRRQAGLNWLVTQSGEAGK